MFKTSLALIVLLIILSTTCYGGEIVLKKSFWWGYSYTKDELQHQVGDGLRLKQNMAGVKEAQVEIDKYRRRRSLYIWFDLIRWPPLAVSYGRAFARRSFETDDTQTFLLISTLATLVAGQLLYHSANSHLKKGVGIYNDSLKQQQANTQRLDFMVTPRSGGYSFAMKYSF
ncbi:MAG TPA: hypothetical protein VGB16_03310 [candidate division Zixibacteria bacterium]